MKKTIFSLVIMVVINFTGKSQTLIDWTDPRVQNLYQEFKNDRTVIEMLNNCTVLPPNVLLLADSSKAYYEDRADGRVPAIYLPVYVNAEMIGVLHWGNWPMVQEKQPMALNLCWPGAIIRQRYNTIRNQMDLSSAMT